MPKDTSISSYNLVDGDASPGFAHDAWYFTPVPRKRLKELMRRSDRPGFFNYGLWMALLIASGALLAAVWNTVWAWPVALVYGVLYGSGANSRWHETGHGTVFRTGWLNDLFHQLTSFMSFRNPYLWKWSHTRHHTDTMLVGRDPEIAFPRPPSIGKWILNILYVPNLVKETGRMVRLAAGRLSDEERTYVPEQEARRVFMASRVHLTILLAVTGLAVWLQSWLPLMLVGVPTFYGSWLQHLLGTTQHAGLAEDIPDHRMNSRTVYLNPVYRFLYSNMNFHVEHHMYPMVPYHALPALHEEIKHDCPPAYPSLWAAYREIIPAILRQQRDPNHYVHRPLPEGAAPTPPYVRPSIAAE